MPTLVFHCKHGWWTAVQLLAFPALFGVAGAALILFGHRTVAVGYALLVLGALLGILFFVCTFPRRYVVTPDQLLIQSGVFRKRVPLARIRSALLTGNPEDPDRIREVRLTLDGGKRIVQPQRRTEFIRVLKERAYL